MVFGYYHINMRTHDASEIPELGLAPGTKISQKVKVGHMLWIPFIPLGKVWTIEQHGQMMSLNSNAAHVIEQKVGYKGTPWYAFFGLIAVPLVFGFWNVSDNMRRSSNQKRYKANFETKVDGFQKSIANPNNEEMFYFKDARSASIPLKVNRSSTDSIYFMAGLDNKGKKWRNAKWASSYFNSDDNPIQIISIAKSDLDNTYAKDMNTSMYKKGIEIPALDFMKSPFQLEKIEKIQVTDDMPIVSASLNNEIKEAYRYYAENSGSLDSMVNLMDKASMTYLEDIFNASQLTDKEGVQFYKDYNKNQNKVNRNNMAYIMNGSSNNCLYELLLYARYVYHSKEAGPELVQDPSAGAKKLNDENLKDFLFFLKLTERGFLTLDNTNIKNAKVVSVSVPRKGIAKLVLKTDSNMLKVKKPISFTVMMTKEDGRWKMNLPSTMSYTDKQLSSNGYGSQISQQWREMVRKNIAELAKGKTISEEWIF